MHRPKHRPRCCVVVVWLLFAMASSPCLGQSIVAHRGASHDAPENTLAAFRLAWEQGADAIEGDFHLTADERIVAKSQFAQLRNLDVGQWKDKKFSGERIPTLAEVLETVPRQKRIFVEIKCGPEIVPALQKQLSAADLADEQIVIIAFDDAVVQACRRAMPRYNCNWLTAYKQASKQADWKPTRDDVLSKLQRAKATGLGTQANREVVDRQFVDSLRDAGFEFHVWTVNDPRTARHFAELGVDSITTDRPRLIRSALQPQPNSAK